MNKREERARRAKRTRMHIRKLAVMRLCVFRTPSNMYGYVTTADGSKTLVTASTLDKELKKELKNSSNVDAAKKVGMLLAKRALEAGIRAVAFDRSGFLYHGRVKALADGAREVGLEF
jgi:large subunit ribosomal protein L18